MPQATPAQIAAVQAHIDVVRAAYDNNTDAPWALDNPIVLACFEAIAAYSEPTYEGDRKPTASDVEANFEHADGEELAALEDTIGAMKAGEEIFIDTDF